MSASDWSTLLSNLLTVYLLYRQNKIFERQNEIFAGNTESGAPQMPNTVPRTLRRYWPMIVMALMVLLMWTATGYSYVDRNSPGRLGPPWIFLPGLLCLIGLLLAAGYTVVRSESPAVERSTATDIRTAPRLQVDFSKSGQHHWLVFKSDKIAFVRKVGPLVSRERYESKHDFTLVPSTPPRIDPGAAVQCRISGLRQVDSPDIRSLLDFLRSGNNEGVDSVVVDYGDDHGNEFSRRFDLTRNQDDSVAWIPEPVVHLRDQVQIPEPEWKNLADLRYSLALAERFPEEQKAALQYGQRVESDKQRLIKLRASYSNFLLSAKVSLLAEDAASLLSEYLSLMEANRKDKNRLDLSRPLGREWIYREDYEDGLPIPWQQLRLMFLREHYNRHSWQLRDLALTGFDSESGLLNRRLPTELRAAEVTDLFENHKKALLQKAEELSNPYVEALNSES